MTSFEKSIDSKMTWLTRLLGALTVALLALGGWSVGLQHQGNTTASQAKQAASQAKAAAAHALAAVKAVQQSRIDITYGQCNAQNDRHDRTIRQLDLVLLRSVGMTPPKNTPLKKLEQMIVTAGSPAESPRLQQAHNSTVLLIEQLAKKTDCAKQLDQRFGRNHLPPTP